MKKCAKTCQVKFKDVTYEINFSKVTSLLSILENNSNLTIENEVELMSYLEKYDLLNKDFLDEINNI